MKEKAIMEEKTWYLTVLMFWDGHGRAELTALCSYGLL